MEKGPIPDLNLLNDHSSFRLQTTEDSVVPPDLSRMRVFGNVTRGFGGRATPPLHTERVVSTARTYLVAAAALAALELAALLHLGAHLSAASWELIEIVIFILGVTLVSKGLRLEADDRRMSPTATLVVYGLVLGSVMPFLFAFAGTQGSDTYLPGGNGAGPVWLALGVSLLATGTWLLFSPKKGSDKPTNSLT